MLEKWDLEGLIMHKCIICSQIKNVIVLRLKYTKIDDNTFSKYYKLNCNEVISLL